MRSRDGLRRQNLTVIQAPKKLVTFEGVGKIASFTPTNPGYTWSCVKSHDGTKYYYGVMGRGDNQRDPWIVKWDVATNRIEQVYRIPIGVSALNADSHRVPNLDIDASNNLYVVCELLSATNGHGTSVLLYKTSSAGNIATLALIKTLTGRWAYPFIKVSGSNVFICARGGTSTVNFIRGQQWYWNSTDGGANFGSPVQLYDSGDEQKVSYMWAQHDYNGGICIVLNERDNDTNNWPFISMIKGTFNSDVWTNVNASVSKNVSSSGAFTRTEMRTDNLVVESSDTINIAVNHEGGIIKSDGSIKMLVSVQSLTGNVFEGNAEAELEELRFYKFSGGSWTFENVTIPANMVFYWAYERLFQYLNNDESFDDVLFINSLEDNDVYIMRSTDDFATQTDTLVLPGNGRYRLGTIPFNAETEEDYALVLVDTIGDPFEIPAETSLDFSNIVFKKL